MAKQGAGGAAAFQQLRAPQDSIGVALRDISATAERRTARREAREEREGVRLEKERTTAFDKLDIADDDFKFKVTGFDSRDDVIRDYATKSVEQFTEIGDQAKIAFDAGNIKEYNNLLGKQRKIKSNFIDIKAGEEALIKIEAKYRDIANKGDMSPVDEEYEGVMQAIFSNNIVVENIDQVPYLTAMVEGDDGTQRKVRIKQSDLVNGNYRPYQKVNISGKGGLIDQFLFNQGKSTVSKETGNFVVTDEVFTEANERAFDANVDALNKRQKSYILYEASGGKIKKKGDPDVYGEDDGFTEGDEKMMKDYLRLQLDNTLSTKVKRDPSIRSTRISQARLNLAEREFEFKQKQAVKKAKPQTLSANRGGELSVNEFTSPLTGEKISTYGYTVLDPKGKPIKGIFSDSADREVMGLEYNQKTGDIFAITRLSVPRTTSVRSKEGRKDVVTTTITTKTEAVANDFRILKDDELNRLAQAANYANGQDLINHITARIFNPPKEDKVQEVEEEEIESTTSQSAEDLMSELGIKL